MGNVVAIDEVSERDLIPVLSSSLYPGASVESIGLVLSYCKAAQLDPMQKPVHIVPMWDAKTQSMRDVIMPGIGLYRTQAARSGEYGGISEPEYGPDVTETIGGAEITYPQWCKVTVYRIVGNTMAEFSAVERWKENYAVRGGKERSIAPNAMWYRRPYGQLAKCTEAQALRKAFPEFGAMPTAEEMEGKEMLVEKDITPTQEERTANTYPSQDFEKNFPTWEKRVAEGKITKERLIAMVQNKGALTDQQKSKINAIEVPQ